MFLICYRLAGAWRPVPLPERGFLLFFAHRIPLVAQFVERRRPGRNLDGVDRRPIGALDIGGATWSLRNDAELETFALRLEEQILTLEEAELLAN